MDIARLGVQIDSDGVPKASKRLDLFAKSGDRAETSTGKLSKSFGGLALAAAGAVSAMVSFGQAVRVIREFESSMSAVGAITGATRQEMEALRDVAKELGRTTEFSAAQAADGLRFLGMAGFSAAESIQAIPDVLNLATASAIGLAQAADITSNVLSGFGLRADEAGQVADVLAAAASSANTSVSQLGQALSTVAPISASLGIDLADTAAAIGKLSDAGIQGERAGTALRGALAALAAPTTQAEAALASYGLSIDQVDPATRTLSEVFGALGEVGLTTADAMTIFGREAASGALVLVDASGDIQAFGNELRAAEGAASDMADTMRDNLQGDVDSLRSAVQGLAIAIGEAGLTAALRAVLQAVTAAARGFTTAITAVTDFFTVSNTLAMAADTVNIAIADEIAQVNALTRASEQAVEVSTLVALNKLREAESHLKSAEAKREEAQANILNSEAYQNVVAQIQSAIEARDSLRTGGDDIDQMPLKMRAAYEEAEQSIVAAFNRQKELLSLIPETSTEYELAAAAVEELRRRIAEAEGGMVLLGGETADAADTTNAIVRLSGLISFDGAAKSAASLAEWLGISLSHAIALSQVTPQMADEDSVFAQQVVPDASMRAAQREAASNFDRIAKSLEKVGKSARKAGGGMSEAAREAERMAGEIERLEFDADPLRRYNAEVAKLDQLRDAGLSTRAYEQAMSGLNRELSDTSPLISGITDGLQSVTSYIFGGFKDGFKGLFDIVKNTLAKVAQEVINTRIVVPITAKLTNGIGGNSANSQGGILGNLLGGGSIFGRTGVFGNLGSSIGTSIGNILGGQGSALAGTLGSLGSTIGAIAPVVGIAAAAFSFFKSKTVELDSGIRVTTNGLESLVETFRTIEKTRFWGLSKKVRTEYELAAADVSDPIQNAINGIGERVMGLAEVLGLASENIGNTAFEFEVTTKGKSDEEIQQQIESELARFGDTLANAAIGTFTEYLPDEAEIARLQGDIEKLDVSELIGGPGEARLDAQRAQLEQQQVAAETAIEIVHLNEQFEGLQREGEGSLAMLERLVTELGAVNEAMTLFGRETLEVSVMSAAAASSLIELSGGLDAFAEKTQFVFDNFLTDAERNARLTEIAMGQLNEAFGGLQIAIPKTHAEFMALLDAQDLNTEAGRQTYTALQDVAAAFVQVNGTAQQAADGASEAVGAIDELGEAFTRLVEDSIAEAMQTLADLDAANRSAFEDAINAQIAGIQDGFQTLSDTLRAEIDFATQAVRSAESALRIIRNALDAREAQEPVNFAQVRSDRAVQALANAVDRGVLPELEVLDRIVGDISNTPQAFATREEYLADFLKTNAVLREAEALADDTLTVEEGILAALELQLSQAQQQNAAVIDKLNEQITAIRDLPVSLAGVLPTGDVNDSGNNALFTDEDVARFSQLSQQINGFYQEFLGRNADVQGLNFYLQAIADGLTLQGVADDIRNSIEANTGNTPGFNGNPNTDNGGNPIGGAPTVPTTPTDPVVEQIQNLYRNILGREADSAGLEFYRNLVVNQAGFDISDVARNLRRSLIDLSQYTGTARQIAEMYVRFLGRAPDAAGLDFYRSLVDSGEITLGRVEQDLRRAGADAGIPAYARGTSFHPGGLALVGEQGPEIANLPRGTSVSTARQTSRMLDTAMLTSEVRSLREEVARMRAENNQGHEANYRENERTSRVINRWNNVGLPAEQTTT